MTYNQILTKIDEGEGCIASIQEDLKELNEENTHFSEATPNYNTFYKKWFLINNSYVRIDDFIIEEYIDEDEEDPEKRIKYKVTKVHGIGFRSESPRSVLNVDSWFNISDIGTENTPSIETLNNIYNVYSD